MELNNLTKFVEVTYDIRYEPFETNVICEYGLYKYNLLDWLIDMKHPH